MIGSHCRQQPLWVNDCCLAVWWPWDRSCFSISRFQLWCTCTDLAFWMIAVWTVSGSGGYCPWWSFWPSCEIRCCRCHGGQVVCPWWWVLQTTPPSEEPCGWGRCSYQTRLWYSPIGCSRLCICKCLSGFWVTSHISSTPWCRKIETNLAIMGHIFWTVRVRIKPHSLSKRGRLGNIGYRTCLWNAVRKLGGLTESTNSKLVTG